MDVVVDGPFSCSLIDQGEAYVGGHPGTLFVSGRVLGPPVSGRGEVRVGTTKRREWGSDRDETEIPASCKSLDLD